LTASSGGFGRGMQPVLWIIAESAAIYTYVRVLVGRLRAADSVLRS
jgi:hypothetical protein